MARESRSDAALLFVAGAAALFWELALIRWTGACIRIVGYFTNFILIAAFLGLGAGALIEEKRLQLRRWLPLALAACVALPPILGAFVHANPTAGEYLWTGSSHSENLAFLGWKIQATLPYWVLLGAAFGLTAFAFLAFGQWLAVLFRRFEPLKAYSIEVAGSLAGIFLFALASALSLPPTAWFAAGFALAAPAAVAGGRAAAVAGVAAVAALGFCRGFERQFHWSPYYKIKVQALYEKAPPPGLPPGPPDGYDLMVNSDFHQKIIDLRPRPEESWPRRTWRGIYDLPYQEGQAGPILIVGAGTGNDVSAALRRTKDPVVAVEIDPAILRLGRELHPERPYDDPRVRVVVDDARSYFARSGESFSKVVFGFLDSHTLFSSFSTLRLDNFIYTLESMRRVRELLRPGGSVYLTFSANTEWIDRRLIGLLDSVFDYPTRAVRAPPGPFFGTVVYVNGLKPEGEARPERGAAGEGLLLPTDDWPFLYMSERAVPRHYLMFLLAIGGLSASSLLLLPRGERRVKLPYFFLGAAFFLIETSNVVKLALLYGSTWTVNVAVFSGILALVLAGNLASLRVPERSLRGVFALLFASCAVSFFVEPKALLLLESPAARAAAATVVFLGPVFVASLVFAKLISREKELPRAYGSNLLGAMLGGVTEYLSLVFGLKALAAFALGFYVLAFLTARTEPS